MKTFKTIILLLARLFISSNFIASAVKKILDWPTAERNFISTLGDWQGYLNNFPTVQKFFGDALSFAPEIILALTAIELLGGLLVFIGIKIRWGAILLCIYSLITTILLYQFWFADVSKKEMQLTLFLQNLAILGGLLFVAVYSSNKSPSKESEKSKGK